MRGGGRSFRASGFGPRDRAGSVLVVQGRVNAVIIINDDDDSWMMAEDGQTMASIEHRSC